MLLANVIDPRFTQAVQKLLSIQVPLSTALKIKLTVLDVDRMQVFYETTRKGLLDRYGSKKEDGNLMIDDTNNVVIAPESMPLFAKEISDLLQRDVAVTKIPVAELENLKLSVDELILLQNVIEL